MSNLYIALLLLAPAANPQPVDFAHDVLPLLKNHCAKCHSNGNYKGEFSLDNRADLLKSGAVKPGKATDSELVARLLSDDEELRMPLKGKPLTAEEIDIFKKWIDQGLAWQEGFSFKATGYVATLKPRTPQLPPILEERSHPVDRLADAYYIRRKVAAPKPIDDALFLRRVSLDLVGLLPTPQETAQFVTSTEPGKRAKKIDELLADNAAYSGHWLSFWNDLLRNDYAGTGFIDGGRKPVTGWLVNSLQQNKPYDQFTRELIHPGGESEGFIRGIKWRGRVNASQTPEVQFAQNISQVFLGVNMKCASCHDSFIDDWKLEDAYGLAAIISDQPLEIHRCDKPTGETARAKFLFPELGNIDPAAPRDQRLAQVANLMTSPENGRFARTMVNRLWERLMGRGIVHPVDVMSNPPWDADLLDWLAADFAASGYDLKHTLKLIVTSQTYQSQADPASPDPTEGEYIFRGPLVRRMSAEQFMDALWSITGAGPKNAAVQLPVGGGTRNKTVRASTVVADPLQRSLGRPNREQVVTTRPAELTTLQALDLSNGEILADTIGRGAAALHRAYGKSPEELVDHVFQSALCRAPSAGEKEVALTMVGSPATVDGAADLLWTVFMLPDFQLIR